MVRGIKCKKSVLTIGILCLIGMFCGYFFYPETNPYDLNYKNITLNLEIEYTRDMLKPGFPLGEKHLAEDMRKEFAKFGYDAKLYSLEESFSNRDFRDGFAIYMRPYPELRYEDYHKLYDEDKISVLYETFPYKLREIQNADIVFTGSMKQNRYYKTLGINSFFLPQFTRTDKFYPAFNEKYKTNIVFIGNQWHGLDTRPLINMIKNTDLKVDIYGNGYDDVLTDDYAKLWKAKYVLPEELKYYYSSADIVLNDTRPDMTENGFISNRIFDVSACKGFIISDYIPEIAEIYGDAVPMYKNEDELKALIEYYLAHPEERRQKAEQAYQITIKNYTAEKIMAQMIEKLQDFRKQRHLKGMENNEKVN